MSVNMSNKVYASNIVAISICMYVERGLTMGTEVIDAPSSRGIARTTQCPIAEPCLTLNGTSVDSEDTSMAGSALVSACLGHVPSSESRGAFAAPEDRCSRSLHVHVVCTHRPRIHFHSSLLNNAARALFGTYAAGRAASAAYKSCGDIVSCVSSTCRTDRRGAPFRDREVSKKSGIVFASLRDYVGDWQRHWETSPAHVRP